MNKKKLVFRKIPKPEKNNKLCNSAKQAFVCKRKEFIPILGVEKIVEREVGFKKNPKVGSLYFSDGSVLHSFENGGLLYVSKRGREILRSNPHLIRDYLNGKVQKGFLRSGGNSNVFVMSATNTPGGEPLIAVKEYFSGISPFSQAAHLSSLRKELKKKSSVSVPEIFLAASLPSGHVKGYLAMQFISASKVSETVSNLEKKIANSSNEQQRESFKRMLKQLEREYADFELRLLKNPKTRRNITELHRGNVLTAYNSEKKRFEFWVLDQ